jgi:hypothetical protein
VDEAGYVRRKQSEERAEQASVQRAGQNRPPVARVQSGADFLRANTRNDPRAETRDKRGRVRIEVQEQAWDAVQVYGHCTWEKEAIVGAKQVIWVYHEITAQEIRAAISLLRIRRDKWAVITHQVMHIMVPAAKPLLNAK